MRSQQFRQGDVFLETVSKVKGKRLALDEGGRIVLASGEVTGHCHEVVSDMPLSSAQVFEEPDGTRYLLVGQTCRLIHPEHGSIILAPGAYRVTRQVEYTPQATRHVAD